MRLSGMRSLCVKLCLAAALVGLVATRAEARTVYLNGVRLDATVKVEPQTISDCEVRIDEKGDVHITAKGYRVVAPRAEADKTGRAGGAPAAPSADGDRRYWLISKFDDRGAAGFSVEVFINGTFVKKILTTDDPLVLDVSRHIHPGENRVTMIATKETSDPAASRSPTDTLEVILGEGIAEGGTVTIDRVHAAFRRNASEKGKLREDFTLKAPQ